MLTIVKAGTEDFEERFAATESRAAIDAERVRNEVRVMLDNIFTRRTAAVNIIALERDNAPPREIPRAELDAAVSACDPVLLGDLRRAARNIEDYQKHLLPESGRWWTPDGGSAGVLIRPVERAGLYVPGGTSAYPSTVLMTAIPARVAGVREILLCTPPGEHLKPEVLAAASIAGVDRVFAIGGVPAIASMALGLGIVPRCDVVAGPGNAYVTEAKRQLYGFCGIESTAGPSDILVLCDGSANPAWAAADLLGQAEHGARSRAVLVTADESFARGVCSELEAQIQSLPRRGEAEASLRDYGTAVVVSCREEALTVVNRIAPEHLEIMADDAESWLDGIRNAGAVFLGPYSPEPLGDYWAGPSHVLPTEGHARFFSPVSAETFLRRASLLSYGKDAFLPIADGIARLARSEGLEAHAKSAEIRGDMG
ncbi:MAG: histidinol dehydrogenase [Oscillospiraceae bacterium]|jgi:histidinol dehydrogenase|nr:histidinol dehydrogenase [Oscillospiraceae bacterium]